MFAYYSIAYYCPACGYSWEESVQTGVLVGTCNCPNCDEPVAGVTS